MRSPLALACLLASCGPPAAPVATLSTEAVPEDLARHCAEHIGPPRVEEVAPDVFVAIGYDLANTMLIRTDAGNIVVDVSMSPARAREVKAALDAVAPGPVKAIVYTHSHIDHVGGAAVWAEPDTEIWATERLLPHFFKQYGTFLPAETVRAQRQFGEGLPDDALPCSALGARPDITAALSQGFVAPTHTFSGTASLTVGDVTLELHEAHGETHDQLYVWWPDRRVLMPGDNWYRAFPNLYTIRGAAPRPVDDWVASLDAMRGHAPELLLPSHTRPVAGADAIADELTAYRDAIQWVKDEVVRGANAGKRVDELAATIALPAHLAERDALAPLYGTVPWSVRAIYGNELGWFDGKAAHLLPPDDVARRSVDLAGGPEAVVGATRDALAAGEPAWAAHLVGWLDADGRTAPETLDPLAAEVYTALGAEQGNTNARGYLLVAADERERGVRTQGTPTLSGDFVDGIPLDQLFAMMRTRLRLDAADVHESVVVRFTDLDRAVVLTIRRGVLEVWWGEPLPGTPAPLATLSTDAGTWRRLALGEQSRVGAFLSGDLDIDGDRGALQRFMGRFDSGLTPPPGELP